MIKDIETVKKYCILSKYEEELLKSNKRPIVLLDKKDKYVLAENLSPNNKKIRSHVTIYTITLFVI